MERPKSLVCDLKRLRIECGFTQTQLAELIGVSQNTISSIETGQYLPSAWTIYMLCMVLNCNFNDLFYLPFN